MISNSEFRNNSFVLSILMIPTVKSRLVKKINFIFLILIISLHVQTDKYEKMESRMLCQQRDRCQSITKAYRHGFGSCVRRSLFCSDGQSIQNFWSLPRARVSDRNLISLFTIADNKYFGNPQVIRIKELAAIGYCREETQILSFYVISVLVISRLILIFIYLFLFLFVKKWQNMFVRNISEMYTVRF